MNIKKMKKAYKEFNESKVNTLGYRWGIEDFMENTIDVLKDIKNRQDRIIDELAKHSEKHKDCINDIAGIKKQLTEFFQEKYQEEEYHQEKREDDDAYMERLYREGKE